MRSRSLAKREADARAIRPYTKLTFDAVSVPRNIAGERGESIQAWISLPRVRFLERAEVA